MAHLLWAPLGVRPLERFLESYREHAAGAEHRLVMIFNGFESAAHARPWREALSGVEHESLMLDRPVLDLDAYRQVSERVAAPRYCFLNSYSVIRAAGWLSALEGALNDAAAGIVGPTGSWGSIRSYQRFALGMGGYYARVFGDRRSTAAGFAAVATRDEVAAGPARRAPLRYAKALLRESYGFTSFPAPHVRTSAFMLDATVAHAIDWHTLKHKADTYRLESGRDSISAQVERMGLTARVVGRDGRSYSSPEWPKSGTFWQGEQENLLIADKQTDSYALSDADARSLLSRYAWGEACATIGGADRSGSAIGPAGPGQPRRA